MVSRTDWMDTMLTNKFYSLHLPQYWKGGIGKDKWAVCTHYSCGEPYAYLHPDLQLHENVIMDDSIGFFDTEFDALIAIKAYCAIYNEPFPYASELDAELDAEISKLNINEQRVMEFV